MKRKSHSILLYSKEGCCLCAGAREMLRRLAAEFPLTIREIDINSDPLLYERYRWTVPAVEVDSKKVLERVTQEEELRSLLQG